MPRFRRLKTALWLAAWGAWVWLGFGLYRELPRDLGPEICRLDFEENEIAIGFLGDDSRLVSMTYKEVSEPRKVRIWDVVSGRIENEWDGPIHEGRDTPYRCSLAHGVLFVFGPPSANPDHKKYLPSVLNLRTGQWTRIAWDYTGIGPRLQEVFFHQTKPWIVVDGSRDELGDHSIRIFDFETGTEIRTVRIGRGESYYRVFDVEDAAYLTDGSDRLIAVPVQVPYGPDGMGDSKRAKSVLKVVSVSTGREDEFVLGRPISRFTVGGNRIAWRDDEPGLSTIKVFDCDHRQTIFSHQVHGSSDPDDDRWRPNVELSNDGRALLQLNGPALWEIDGKKSLWEPRHGDSLRYWHDRKSIEVGEDLRFDRLLQGLEFVTYAIRDFSSGELLYRSRKPRGHYFSNKYQVKYPEMAVYDAHFRVNWPLFLGAQTILALPLVGLWGIGKWLKRRRGRMPA